jgi:RimJ/RimL family protein N-acetyltransferase
VQLSTDNPQAIAEAWSKWCRDSEYWCLSTSDIARAWGKGYGTDAMRVVLRYAFTELNLHRVSLDVFSYNPRAIRSYEKAGFKYEGCMRSRVQRDGKRWNMVFMGIMKEEWEESEK